MDPKLAAVITLALFALGVVFLILHDGHRRHVARRKDRWYQANRLARRPLPPLKQ